MQLLNGKGYSKLVIVYLHIKLIVKLQQCENDGFILQSANHSWKSVTSMEKHLSEDSSLANVTPYRHGQVRFLVLGLLAFVCFANQYTFNNPQALQNSIEQELNIEQAKFNMLYSIIAIPNIIFAIFIGVIIDYFGIRISFLILAIGLPVCQIIVALGGFYRSYDLMLVGRLFYGIIDQSVQIAQACYVSSWFMGKQLSFALGLAITIPQFGSALNSYATPIIYEKTQSLGPPLFTSVGICFIALICALIVTYIDKKADQADQLNNIRILTELDIQQQQNQTIKFEDLKILKSTYWIISVLCTLAIAQYIPFLNNANKLLQVRFCFSQVTAGQIVTIVYIVVGLFGFPIGWIVDKVGYKRYFIMIGMTIFTIGHTIILLYPQCTNIDIVTRWSGVSWGLFFLGIGYCFYANCLIPAIPLIVSKKVTGTAFGIMEMLSNIAMAIYPQITGIIIQDALDEEKGYRHTSLFFVVTGLFGMLISTFLLFINHSDKAKLDASSKQKLIRKTTLRRSNSEVDTSVKKKNSEPNYFSDYTDVYSEQETKKKGLMKKFQMQLSNTKQQSNMLQVQFGRKGHKYKKKPKQQEGDGDDSSSQNNSLQQALIQQQKKQSKKKDKQKQTQQQRTRKIQERQRKRLRRLQGKGSYSSIVYL